MRSSLCMLPVVIAITSTLSHAQELISSEPVKHICGTSGSIIWKVVGNRGDLIEIWDAGRLIIKDYSPARDANPNGTLLNCGSGMVKGDLIAINMGRNQDIVHIFKISRDKNGKALGAAYIFFAVRDSYNSISFDSSNNTDVLINAGRNRNVYYRLCSNWKGDPTILGSGHSREIANPPCTVAAVSRGDGPGRQNISVGYIKVPGGF